MELLTEFVPFSINKKALLGRAAAVLEQNVLEGELYGEAMELMQQVEAFLLKASFSLNGDIGFSKISFPALLRSSGLEFREDYDSLAEKLVDYMELVTEYERKKLFIFYNLRSLISDRETALFLDTVLRHEYHVLMVESGEHMRLPNEERYIVDESLCEIC